MTVIAAALTLLLVDPGDPTAHAKGGPEPGPNLQCDQETVSGNSLVACVWQQSSTVSFSDLVDELNGTLGDVQITSDTPVWVQASSGIGGSTKSTDSRAGYAITVSTPQKLDGDTLYMYVGENGTRATGGGGQGGSSSIVSTTQLSQSTDGVLVIAGGSGGSGQECTFGDAGKGGDGGVAIATQSEATGAGEDGSGSRHGYGGDGNGGSGHGGGGSNGSGGLGGGVGKGLAPLGWNDVDAVDPNASDWTEGEGASNSDGGGGAGGGGYGGGGAALACPSGGTKASGGGGGGGSYAVANAVEDPAAPAAYVDNHEVITLTFDLGGGGQGSG